MKLRSLPLAFPSAVPRLFAASVPVAAAAALSLSVLVAEEEGDSESGGDGSVSVAGLTFSFAEPWVEKQVTSRMRAAELTYDHQGDDLADVDVVFYHFPNQGGGTRDNLDRWIGQFAAEPAVEVEEEEMEFDGRTVTLLTASGTYNESSGGPFSGTTTPRDNYTMLAAVVETGSGPVFLKLYGPDASVDALKDDFKKLLISPFADE